MLASSSNVVADVESVAISSAAVVSLALAHLLALLPPRLPRLLARLLPLAPLASMCLRSVSVDARTCSSSATVRTALFAPIAPKRCMYLSTIRQMSFAAYCAVLASVAGGVGVSLGYIVSCVPTTSSAAIIVKYGIVGGLTGVVTGHVVHPNSGGGQAPSAARVFGQIGIFLGLYAAVCRILCK